MRTAVHRVDVVGERDDVFVVAVVVLQRHLGDGIAVVGRDVDHIRMQHLIAARLVHEIHKRGNTALVAIFLFDDVVGIAAVVQPDAQPRVEERLLAQPFLQHIKFIFGGFGEDFRIRFEPDGGAIVVRGADHGQIVDRVAALKPLGIYLAVAGNFHFQPFGQRVHHRRAHAVQTAGHLVAAAAEFTTGVQHGQHHRDGGDAHFVVDTDRDTATVILDADDVTRQNVHINVGAIPRQRFVDGVIHNFVHQMVQSARAGGADVHTGALTHRFQPLQHLDLAFVIGRLGAHHLFFLFQFLLQIFFVIRHGDPPCLFCYMLTVLRSSPNVNTVRFRQRGVSPCGAAAQCRGRDLANIHRFVSVGVGTHHKRTGQLGRDIYHPTALLRVRQKGAGAFGKRGAVHIKNSDHLAQRHHRVAAQMDIHTRRLLWF